MPRIPRNYMTVPFFHIMTQGINKEYIFENNIDKRKYIELINLKKENLRIRLLAYCIMDNHSHILVKIEKIEQMTEFMQKINTKYAIYYNKKYNRVGYVFKNRYKSQPIQSMKHLLCCIDYIHNNPVKAGICKDKSDYLFSSFSTIYSGSQEQVKNELENIIIENTIVEEEVEEFILLEDESIDKKQICREYVSKYIKDRKISKVELIKDKKILKEIVKELRNKDISYRTMQEVLGISRETLRNLLKKANYIELNRNKIKLKGAFNNNALKRGERSNYGKKIY